MASGASFATRPNTIPFSSRKPDLPRMPMTARSISLLAMKMVPVSPAIPLADTPTADYFPTAAICAATSRRGLRMGEGASPDRRRITT
jgi:hypothetical protein